MSIKYLNLSGLEDLWINIKNYILSKIPTKTSELTNDSGYLTSHQSLSNYVTLNGTQTISGAKTFSGLTKTAGKTEQSSPSDLNDAILNAETTYWGTGTTNKPTSSYGTLLTFNREGNVHTSTSNGWLAQLGIGTDTRLYLRTKANTGGAWSAWKEFLTSHQSLSNYVTLNSNQTITAIKTITGGNQGKMIFKNPNFTVGTTPESTTTVARIYFGGGASYDGSTGVITNDISSNGYSQLEICALNNNSSSSYRTSLILRYEQDQTRPRFIKSWGDFCPYYNDTYYLGRSDSVWKECYCNAYYLGTTAFGDIVTHNASEFLTSHQSLSSCVKNNVTNNQTIKSTAITRGTAPSSAQTFGIAFIDNNNKYIGNIYGLIATDMSISVGLYAYKGSTTANSDNVGIRVGYDAWGNAYTYAPTPATADNSTQIATTAFVKAQGYLTSHPSITLSSNTTSTASPAHGGTFTCIDSVTQDTNGHITKVNTKTITLPADSNTDTKVTQTVTTANSNYPVLLCATADATATGTTTSRFSAGLTVNTKYSSIYITNKYDTANTKGVRNTSSYNNGILYFRSYDATQMGLIRCDSHKSGYQHIYMQATNYIKNGTIDPEGTATTCSIAVRVRDNGSKTIYTEGSWENSLTPYINETYDLGTSSLRWMRCYCKNFYGSYVDIAGRYLGNEYSTNASTCLYLKSKRDTDGKSGIYFSKFRQNRAQGALTGSDLVDLSLDVLENSVRTNSCISISFRYFENDVPTKIYVIPKKSATSYMGTSDNPWTNAYITNLNLNGDAFDPTSINGIGTIKLLAYEPTSTTDQNNSAGITKPGSSLYDVRMKLHSATGHYGVFDSTYGEFSVIIDAHGTQSGTWKVLQYISADAPQSGAHSFAIGLWVKIA